MRQPFIAGNWKMNLDRASSVALVVQLAELVAESSGEVEIGVCPPACYLEAVGSVVIGSEIGLGAQNMYHEESGAFTGELSAAMLLDLGCKYVILGHSERRQLFGETDASINEKLKAALAAGLTPIVCVGETLEEREFGQTESIVETQFEGSFSGIEEVDMLKCVIAYEPVWAIGTGKVATPDQAEAVHAHLRKVMTNQYNSEIAEQIRIQYGGSVKPGNAEELLSQKNVDGALVGGASLKADDFAAIIAAAKSSK
ncbi:Triosephosphate isomerase [Planctomycetales bacterium 10988]|nr:Triosephosphate isomerase [Planctomycetales bacterium 10988]